MISPLPIFSLSSMSFDFVPWDFAWSATDLPVGFRPVSLLTLPEALRRTRDLETDTMAMTMLVPPTMADSALP